MGRVLVVAVVLWALALAGARVSLPTPLGTLTATAAQAKTRSQLSDELAETRSRLKEARDAIARAEALRRAALGEIEVLDQRIDGIEAELATLTGRRDAAAAELSATRAELDRLTSAIEERRAQLAKAEQDLATAQASLERRAVDIYKSGRLGYVEVLFDSTRLSDLVNRFDLFSMIVEQDEAVVDQIEALRSRVTAEKAGLETEQARVAALEGEQAGQKARLDSLVEDRQDSLDRLAEARSDKRSLVAQAEKDKAAWERQEDALLAESRTLESDLRTVGEGSIPVQGTGQLIWPVSGRLSSGFGYRIHPIFHVRKMHTGIDIGAGSGTPIKAADSGTVVQAGWRGGYGKTVVVAHGGGLTTLYAHQSAILVGVGDTVDQGDVIGRVGSTGYSTGPHLHFEVRVDGRPVDPMRYL